MRKECKNMLIDTITLNNFRQYKGTNNIQFSTNPEKM